MELTESEAKAFWPIYDQYQKELQRINQRIVKLLESYADDARSKSKKDVRPPTAAVEVAKRGDDSVTSMDDLS